MAAQLFNRIGQIGLGVAIAGGVVNSALYNGMDSGLTNMLKLLYLFYYIYIYS